MRLNRKSANKWLELVPKSVYYENVVYINFKDNESAKKIFDGDFVVDRMTLDISAMIPGIHFVPEKTVIIFDEVQECANARASIKAFMLDGRYDIICTGSLLGIKGYNRKKNRGVPTGFEHILYMKPMDFEEFLWAKGISEEVLEEIRNCLIRRKPVSETIHTSMLRYFREYMCVGGMPYVVDRFLATNDMNVVREEQIDILEEFKDDFGKHLDENEKEEIDPTLLGRINRVFDSIPSQLAKENKKFMYAMLDVVYLFDRGAPIGTPLFSDVRQKNIRVYKMFIKFSCIFTLFLL